MQRKYFASSPLQGRKGEMKKVGQVSLRYLTSTLRTLGASGKISGVGIGKKSRALARDVPEDFVTESGLARTPPSHPGTSRPLEPGRFLEKSENVQ